MKATINGKTYDTEKAKEICNNPSPDGDDTLYRTPDGKFFVEVTSTFADGVQLRPDQSLEDVAPEISPGTAKVWGEVQYQERVRRTRTERRIIPLSDRETLVWCVKTQLPDCFRACVLDSI
jgi:hypothetical protein